MEQNPISDRVDALKRFFRFNGPKEWGRESGLNEETASDAYRLETAKMQAEAVGLVRALADVGQPELIGQLLQNPKQDLLVPICRTLAELGYHPPVTNLIKLYRGNSPESQVAILGVVAATGALAGYPIALEAVASTHQAVRDAGGSALVSLGTRHAVVAATQALFANAPLPEGELDARQIAALVVEHLPLDMGSRVLKELRTQAPELATGVQGALLQMGEEHKPLLLLLSQDWNLGESVTKQCVQAFHRASSSERIMLLNVVKLPVAIRLVAYALEPSGKRNLEQVLSHLESDAPHLIPHVIDPLLGCAAGAAPLLGARALALLGRHIPEVQQVRAGIPRRLLGALVNPDMKPLRRALTTALVSTDAGRQLLAEERLSPTVSFELTALLASPKPAIDCDAVFSALADGLSRELVLDTERLNWLFNQASRVGSDTLARCVSGISRAVSAQIRYGQEEVVEALMAALQDRTKLWSLLAPQVMPALVGVEARRLQQVVSWTLEHDEHALQTFASALAPIESSADVLLDGIVGCEVKFPGQATAWLAQNDQTAKWRQWLNQAASDLATNASRVIAAFQSEDSGDRAQLEDSARQLLEHVAEAVPTLGEQYSELAEQLVQYLGDLEEAVYAAVDETPVSLPSAPIMLGDPIGDYMQAHVIHGTVQARYRDRHLHFKAAVGYRIGLALEKLQLLVPRLPAQFGHDVISPVSHWVESIGLLRIEPELGRQALFNALRHEKIRPDVELERYTVLTWGLAAPDGSIIRPALVGPPPQPEGR